MPNKALFLDRDGVINVDKHHVYKIEDCEFIDGIFDLCRKAKSEGYLIIVVTNQAGIAKGKYTEEDYFKFRDYVHKEFENQGCPIDAEYFCPYHTEAVIEKYRKDSYDRKPNPGMILKAQKDFDIDLSQSILIGDKESDIEAGKRAGIGKNICLINEYFYKKIFSSADTFVNKLSSCTHIICPDEIKRIGYLCPFDNAPMAELETRKRFEYACKKLGHEFIPLNSQLKTFDTNIHADNLKLDFILSHDTVLGGALPVPNHFCIFMHWAPSGYMEPNGLREYFLNMYKYDDIVGGYESNRIKWDCLDNDCLNYSFFNITSSVPRDFIQKINSKKIFKLFYVGINLERIQKSGLRYGKLIKELDSKNLIEIYGPNSLFGYKNLWKGFKNYIGEVPFDGKSILNKINNAGVCLAFNSPVHNDCYTVSNRIYEAAAAGAIIITDNNPYIKKYFGNSVFYIDINKPENEQCNEILSIIEYINNNTEKALDMARNAQQCFLKYLTIDAQIEALIPFVEKRKQEIYCITTQNHNVDIICYIDCLMDWQVIEKELSAQYYKNLNILLVTSEDIYKQIIKDCKFNTVTFIQQEEYKGASFNKILNFLKGDAFLFINKYSAMHKNHIAKMVESLFRRNNLFVYSGTYLKVLNNHNETICYDYVNSEKLTRNDFLSFTYPSNENMYALFEVEKRFALSCCLFKREILKYHSPEESQQVSNAPHIYLALCSIIKANQYGHYLKTVSSGYQLHEGKTINNTIFEHRNYFYKWNRTHKTFVKEMLQIFYKYDYEADYMHYNRWGNVKEYVNTINNNILVKPKYRNILLKFYKTLPNQYCLSEVADFLNRHKYLKFFLKFLCIFLNKI